MFLSKCFSYLERLFALSCAILLAQFPQFYLQYLHQVEGHLAELIYHVSILEKSALLSKKTLPQIIEKFLKNPDVDIARQGELMQGILERFLHFQVMEKDLSSAPLLLKPFQFARYLDFKIAEETFLHFQPGLILTWEGFFYALIGFAFGSIFFQIIKVLVKKKDARTHHES